MLLAEGENEMKLIFSQLDEYGALELFFIYLRNVVYSFEKIAHMKRNHDKVKNFK